jgi:bla regulator protein blaR1
MMLATIARASLEGAAVAVLVWIVIALMPRLSAATRAVLWWCAAAKFLVALVWVTPLELRVLPPAARVESAASYFTWSVVPTVKRAASSIEPSSADAGGGAASLVNRSSALVALWVIGLIAGATIDLRRWRRTRAIVLGSSEAPASTTAVAAALAEDMGVRSVPAVRISHEIRTPLVAGVWRPHILLPGAAALPEEQQRMALCHELAHVKRADLWLGTIPALTERLFFFHPLMRLAAREYALCREAACDAAVIDTLAASAGDYGRLLLDLGVSRHRAGLAVAGASSSYSSLKRRISMLRDSSSPTAGKRLMSAAAIALAMATIAPLRLAARPQAQAAPTAHHSRAWDVADIARIWFGPGRARVSGSGSAAPVAGEREQRTSRELNYVLLLDDHNTHVSGTPGDVDRAKQYRRGSEPLLWFRQDGAEHVVRDPQVIDQVLAIWKPVVELGDAQGEVGGRQGVLGTKQGEFGTEQGLLGTRQGQLGTRQGEIAGRQVELALREQAARTAAERRALEAEQRRLDAEAKAAEAEMRALDAKMRTFDEPMRELGRQMDVLGAEMKVLGRKMEEASKRAEAETRALLARALASGVAERVK